VSHHHLDEGIADLDSEPCGDQKKYRSGNSSSGTDEVITLDCCYGRKATIGCGEFILIIAFHFDVDENCVFLNIWHLPTAKKEDI
jgi:hypothetical protein